MYHQRKTRTPEQRFPEMVEHAYKKVWYELNKMEMIKNDKKTNKYER